jgi:hypothetical protein
MINRINSTFANIFLNIQDYITQNVPQASYVNQDLGQLRGSGRLPVSWPCVLIDFEDFTFENLGENVQTASGTVVIQIGFAPYSNTTSATPEQYKEQALAYYEAEQLLHTLLQGWAPLKASGSLIRTSVTTQKRSDNYRVRELRYSLALEDYSTQTQ